MASDVETYLRELQAALVSSGADPALIQDALFDAEEHLQAEMAGAGQAEAGPGTLSETERDARFAAVVEGYGTPEEVAAAYLGSGGAPSGGGKQQASPVRIEEEARARCAACGTEARPDQAFCVQCGAPLGAVPRPAPAQGYPPAPYQPVPRQQPEPGYPPAPGYQPGQPVPTGVQYGMQSAAAPGSQQPSVWQQIFGPFADGRVWTSLVYMILSLATGIAYFTIVVTGLSTAGGMLVLIIGIPLFMLVLAIVRGLALFEGRLVEALLGTRMPRRSRPTPPNFGFWQRMLFWLKDGRTWASMAYMLLMLPIGIVYFTIAVTGLAVGLSLVTTPIWAWMPWVVDHSMIEINGITYDWPLWAIPIAFVVGALLLIGFMHLVKWVGRGHAAFAKAMLVRLN